MILGIETLTMPFPFSFYLVADVNKYSRSSRGANYISVINVAYSNAARFFLCFQLLSNNLLLTLQSQSRRMYFLQN